MWWGCISVAPFRRSGRALVQGSNRFVEVEQGLLTTLFRCRRMEVESKDACVSGGAIGPQLVALGIYLSEAKPAANI
jgi:hypothetical protein